MTAVVLALGSGAHPADEPDALLAGRNFTIKGHLLRFTLDGVSLTQAIHDLPREGARLRIFDVGGAAGDKSYVLPGSRWSPVGFPAGSLGYIYRGAGAGSDPCREVIIRGGRVKGVCRGSAITFTPPAAGPMAIVLTVGTTAKRYCAEFGGRDIRNRKSRLTRRASPAPTACPVGRPNIVLIYTDDQRWDTIASLPVLQASLINQGVTFTNSFVSLSGCCPSRASLLTGQYAHNTGILTNVAPYGGAPGFVGKDGSTLATWLHEAGYRTGIYGKYLNQYYKLCSPRTMSCYVPPGWDEWHVFWSQGYYDYQLSENGPLVGYGSSPEDYSTDVLKAKAVDFINASDGRPFFLYLSVAAPHADGYAFAVPAERHAGFFDDLPRWRPASYDEEDVSDKPVEVAGYHRADDPLGVFFTFGSFTDTVRKKQLESLLAVDEAIGAIMSALDATGQGDDTVVAFTSDNGLMWGEHRRWSTKACWFEECLRVPLVIRYPRLITAPRQESRTAVNIDLAPTFAELAGVTPPTSVNGKPVNGRSLMAVLRNQPSPGRTDFLIEYWEESTGALSYAGVRTADWKYVDHPGTGERELYHLPTDPAELNSLHADPAYGSVAASLKARLEELERE